MTVRRPSVLALALVLAACGGGAPMDAGPTDAGTDTGADAGRDAGADAGTDAGHDAGTDADAGCPDADGDGHPAASCGGDDCDDADPLRYPGRPEVCDGHDDDCDPTTLGPDGDGDGQPSTACCNPQPTGAPLCGRDCDDTTAAIGPSGVESCNGRDDDCDGMVDEGLLSTFCFDTDGDGHGDLATATQACAIPLGATTICNDCDDTDPSRHPGADETCDGRDHDCDRGTDDLCACLPVGATHACGDAVGACTTGVQTCEAGGWSNGCTGATLPSVEVCNGVDDDCDGTVDEGLLYAYFADCDGDGYGDDATYTERCAAPVGVPPGCPSGGWAMVGGDCDDTSPTPVACPPPADAGVDLGTPCVWPLADCDGIPGCETNLAADVTSCGACGFACLHPAGGCAAGMCQRDYVALDAGEYVSCGVRGDGTVECWGDNSAGQLAAPAGPDVLLPMAIPMVTGALDVSVGARHQCARTRDGNLTCFGSNGFGELGDGGSPGGTRVAMLALGGDVAGSTAGEYYECVVHASGAVQCWGDDMFGQLGDPTSPDPATLPRDVVLPMAASGVSAGRYTTCAVLADGTADCWGENGYGTLGDGTFTPRLVPTAVSGLAGASRISVGWEHACAIVGGELWCWGSDAQGELGDGMPADRSNVPVHVGGLTGVADVGCGADFTCARTGDGYVWCWGTNAAGQLGDGTGVGPAYTPTMALTDHVQELAVGTNHACALRTDHSIVCWGTGADGELGVGSTADSLMPVAVTDP